MCHSYEPCRSESGPILSQINRPFVAVTGCISRTRRRPLSERDFVTLRSSEDDGFPTPVHAGEVWDGRQGRAQLVPVTYSPVEAAPLSFRLCRARHRLPVLS